MASDLHEKVLDILLAHVDYEQDRLRGIADEIVAVVIAEAVCHDCLGLGTVGNMNTGEMETCGVCKGTGREETA